MDWFMTCEAAKEIDREFSRKDIARVPDMDSAISESHVEISATRHVGEVSQFIKKVLRKYGLTELVEVSSAV